MSQITQKPQNALRLLNGYNASGQSILDVFVVQNTLDLSDADKLKKHFRTNREIENFLTKNRLVTRDTINKAYGILLKLPFVSLQNFEISKEALAAVPEKFARKYGVVPFGLNDNILRLAVARPADLLAQYAVGLANLLEKRELTVELYITGENDFISALKQYGSQNKSALLMKRGSLPVVYLRNQNISVHLLHKMPKDFIAKYRLVVFAEKQTGGLMIACEEPDSVLTKKIIDYIVKENGVAIELFATSREDIDYVLKKYDQGSQEETESQVEEEPVREGGNKAWSASFLESLFVPKDDPAITIDEVPQLRAFEEGEPKEGERQIAEGQRPKAEESAKSPGGETEKEVKIENEPIQAAELPAGAEGDRLKVPAAAEEVSVKEKRDQQALEENKLDVLLDGREISTDKDLGEIVSEAYVPKIVAGVIDYALVNKASDVHLEPGSKHLRVRCRVDGILRDIVKVPLKLHPPIISRIKIMSRLKIDETRIPQDGRFGLIFKSRNVDVRVSTLPTIHGEKVVLRILDKDQTILSLEDLGMQGSAFNLTIQAIGQPYGIILATGPTGSGKSTTLYALLSRLSIPGINIVTLEDPVEYEVPGVSQCQVKPEIGFNFATGLRSVLRQDPNVIMVGEVRDVETAGMATHAALTGHLVLTTLHTNDTAGTLPRLINMGVEPFLITSSINVVVAQRLVRRICVKCKEEMKVPEKLKEEVAAELQKIPPRNYADRSRFSGDIHFYYGRGCENCSQGFRGRVGVFEVMGITPEIEELAISRRSANEIKEAAIRSGMITMRQDGILKALQGLTTIDEVLQATLNNT
ncbi:MAG: ATPase, T2SS/T4P/T4SS family [Patescibacteria group bacterium]